jgi:hypothetical protein
VRTRPFTWILIAAVASGGAACGAAPRELATPVVRGRANATANVEEARRLWADRLDVNKLRGAIAAWRRAVELADDDAESWLMLARASYFLGDGFLDFEKADNALVTRTFEEGAAYADRGLRALSRTYEERRRAGQAVDEAAAGLGVYAVPFIYWWGLNIIRWADREGWAAGARTYKHVHRVMEMVAKLSPDYDHAGAQRYFAAFYVEAPGIVGGDVNRGKEHIDEALRLEPSYLDNWLVLAARYARKAKDASLYERARRMILDTPASAVPDAVPEMEIAKKKVRKMDPTLDARGR